MKVSGVLTHTGDFVTHSIVFNEPFKDDKYTIDSDKFESFDIKDKTTKGFSIVLHERENKYKENIKWYAGYSDVKLLMTFKERPKWICEIEFEADDEKHIIIPPDRHHGEKEYGNWIKQLNRTVKTIDLNLPICLEKSRNDARNYFKTLLNQGWVKTVS